MSKRKAGPKRNDAPAKIDAEILGKARIVAAFRDITLAEYVSDILRDVVERDLQAEVEKTGKATNPKKSPRAKG